MVRPMMNPASIGIILRTTNVLPLSYIVECLRRDVSNMSESVPLSSRLSVKLVFIVVGDSFCQWLDLMLERLSSESWDFWDVQW